MAGFSPWQRPLPVLQPEPLTSFEGSRLWCGGGNAGWGFLSKVCIPTSPLCSVIAFLKVLSFPLEMKYKELC
jgi:hypothetical protein